MSLSIIVFPQRKTAVHPYALRFCIGEDKGLSAWAHPGGAFLYFRRDLRLRRRGAYSPRLTHGLRVVSPQGKRLTMICASLALLHPLLSLTHWIFRSLMLPYKSSSHSASTAVTDSLDFQVADAPLQIQFA